MIYSINKAWRRSNLVKLTNQFVKKKWLVNNPCRRQIFANKLIWINFFIKKRILLKLNSLEGKRVAFMNNLNGIIIFPEWTKCIAHNINLNIFIIVDKRIWMGKQMQKLQEKCMNKFKFKEYYIFLFLKNNTSKSINQKPYDFEAL